MSVPLTNKNENGTWWPSWCSLRSAFPGTLPAACYRLFSEEEIPPPGDPFLTAGVRGRNIRSWSGSSQAVSGPNLCSMPNNVTPGTLIAILPQLAWSVNNIAVGRLTTLASDMAFRRQHVKHGIPGIDVASAP